MVRKGPYRVALRRAQGDTRLRQDFGILGIRKMPPKGILCDCHVAAKPQSFACSSQ